jgi:itaconyl-CoA hydratase
MTRTVIEIAPGRFRESFGRHFEDFEIGHVYEHFDNAYAAQSEFGKPLVNSCLTLAIVVGMSVSDVSQKAIGNLGWNDIRLVGPVFCGDTLYAESTVMAKRESASRPTQGIVTVRTVGRKADATEVISFERTVLVPKRGHAIDD